MNVLFNSLTIVSIVLNKTQDLLTHRFVFLSLFFRVMTKKIANVVYFLFVRRLFVTRTEIDSIL